MQKAKFYQANRFIRFVQKGGHFFLLLLVLLSSLFGISFFAIYYDVMANSIQAMLKFKIDPSYLGGEIAALFYDPMGDDFGPGTLRYPTHRTFAPGTLDLVRYTVHEPVWGAKWVTEKDYWQIVLDFAAPAQEQRNIRIYIHVTGMEGGRLFPRDEMAEGVAFDPEAGWHYGIAINPFEASFFSADGTLSVPFSPRYTQGGKRVQIRIPLKDRRLHHLYTETETKHYVYVGAWTPWARDGFTPLARRASADHGGGMESAFSPKIYDLLVDETKDDATELQKAMLSSWDEEALAVPTLFPVTVPMRAEREQFSLFGSGKANTAKTAERNRLQALLEAEEAEAQVLAERDWEEAQKLYSQAEAKGDMEGFKNYALAAFFTGHPKEAERAIDILLKTRPEDPELLAYKGSLVALRGGEASPLLAVELVTQAYRYLDRAVELASGIEEEISARLNRGSVSKAVPNTVFGKASQGAEDFFRLAELFKTVGGEKSRITLALLDAAICLENAGHHDEAKTWLREAERSLGGEPLPARLALKLLE